MILKDFCPKTRWNWSSTSNCAECRIGNCFLKCLLRQSQSNCFRSYPHHRLNTKTITSAFNTKEVQETIQYCIFVLFTNRK